MIKSWIITGDTHGQNPMRLGNIARSLPEGDVAEETGVIILGDAGYNFYLNKTDKKNKHDTHGLNVYCVRGNHEERPENLGYNLVLDNDVGNMVYIDPINNKIRYFVDGAVYTIDGHKVLVIGGAYSVDKWYRLERAAAAGRSFTGWFEDEQLTQEEMDYISKSVNGKQFDIILSHTCPISWEPSDLFIGGIDQNKVDKTMELWLDTIKDQVDWKIWLFGHYHADRIERPGVEQYFNDFEPLENIWERWTSGRELDWWLVKSPNYYMGR